jgi:monofunctional biosynthetic peptidoglycan transglycosylase
MEWPKRRILECYLNVAQFDDYTFGVNAAARQLFAKAPAQLTREEAALLAAALPAPDRFDVADPSAYLRQRQAWILEEMQGLGGTEYLRGVDDASAKH